MRSDGRNLDQLRDIKFVPGFQTFAPGSTLIQWGKTWVLCTASVEESVPSFRQASNGGWLTAEYNMLPGSTPGGRKSRRTGGRETEIQRLIGRALRAAVDLEKLGPRTVTIDCDVVQADGGTRVASITGGYVALALALRRLQQEKKLSTDPLFRQVAAVSLGIVDGETCVDLPYVEDSRAAVDMNLVMTATGELIEIQGAAEGAPFRFDELQRLIELGRQAIAKVCVIQREALTRGEG